MVRNLSRSAIAALAVAVPLIFATTTPASAATAAGSAVTGAGTITPGLGVAGPAQNFSFSGSGLTTGVVCGIPEAAVSHTITAGGNDIIGSYAAGEGNVTVQVSGNAGCPGGLTLKGTYVREGVNVHVAVTAGTTAATADCVFQPNQNPPAAVTSYKLTCAATIAGTA